MAKNKNKDRMKRERRRQKLRSSLIDLGVDVRVPTGYRLPHFTLSKMRHLYDDLPEVIRSRKYPSFKSFITTRILTIPPAPKGAPKQELAESQKYDLVEAHIWTLFLEWVWEYYGSYVLYPQSLDLVQTIMDSRLAVPPDVVTMPHDNVGVMVLAAPVSDAGYPSVMYGIMERGDWYERANDFLDALIDEEARETIAGVLLGIVNRYALPGERSLFYVMDAPKALKMAHLPMRELANEDGLIDYDKDAVRGDGISDSLWWDDPVAAEEASNEVAKGTRYMVGMSLYAKLHPDALISGAPIAARLPGSSKMRKVMARSKLPPRGDHDDGGDVRRRPHYRRWHLRYLGSEFYKAARGKVIEVDGTWVNMDKNVHAETLIEKGSVT